jgi:hypothetical protein
MRKRFPILLFFLLLLSACSSALPTVTPPPAQATPIPPTSTPAPTAEPAILSAPLQAYQAADNRFSLEIPEAWQPFDDGGGVRFQDKEDPYTSLTAFYFPLPPATDPLTFLREEGERALARAQLNDPNNLQIITHDIDPDEHLRIEAIGKFFADQPPQHIQVETWVENNVLLGMSLSVPQKKWPEIGPIWPKLRQSYHAPTPDPAAITGLAYVHPGGLFTVTVPIYWGINADDYDGVILGDMQGLAQFGVSVEELDHYPTPDELDKALKDLLGDAPLVDGYLELSANNTQSNRRSLQFELPSGDEGIYRTELQVFGDRNLLVTTSFSVPPHDWDFFAPDYKLLLESIQTRGDASPDEAIQDADPLAGIEVGVPQFYLDRQGRMQVAAPIRNFRTRPVTRLSASIKLYDKEGVFLAAESWRMLQQRLGPGNTTWLYLALPATTTDLKQVATVKIQLIDARDAKKMPYPAWVYQTGEAQRNSDGDVIIRATLSNGGKKVQKYIFVTALLYDDQGNILFAKSERQRLRYATPGGNEVDVKITLPGPFSHIASFDILGEQPLLD